VARESAIGVASEIWPHGRYRFDFTGEANHAGTTRMEDRHDPMLTYAHTALTAAQQAQRAGVRATFGRLSVEPNGTNAIPSRATAWLDARSDSDQALAMLVQDIVDRAGGQARIDGTQVTMTAESVSDSVNFHLPLAHRIADPHQIVRRRRLLAFGWSRSLIVDHHVTSNVPAVRRATSLATSSPRYQ
jgi:N-carbamoyl-L-amino-acid hydrolase